MNIDDALAYLDEHINVEATAGRVAGLSLDPITELLGALGDPQTAYPVIHVTGTNGKGSTVAMISELLLAHGLTVGQYTSPHLVSINERIARNGEPIADDELAQAIERVVRVEAHTGQHPSYFEIVTAAALGWFADVGVEVAVVEVGLLGRWDATNIVDAAVAVITNVGKDHTDGAEGWREQVAAEKAGIIKPSSDVVLGEPDEALRQIFASEPAASLVVRPDDFDVVSNQLAVGGRLIALRTPRGLLDELYLPVHGAHQADNALLAVTAVEAFFDRPLDREAVDEAFSQLRLPGRFEIVGRNPLVVLDGAHNPGGAHALADTLADFNVARRVFVIGLLGGRNIAEMLHALQLSPGDLVIACSPTNPRALAASDIASAAEALGVSADVVDDPIEAFDSALAVAGEEDGVVITGSLYVVGAVRPVVVDTETDTDAETDTDTDDDHDDGRDRYDPVGEANGASDVEPEPGYDDDDGTSWIDD